MRRRPLSVAAAMVTALVVAGSSLQAPPAQAETPYRITIRATESTLVVGEQITFSGKVRPNTAAARKQRVKLQVSYPGGSFETTSLDKLNERGRYQFTEFFNAPGTYVMRTRIAAGRGHSEGISEELTIIVN